MRKVPAAGSAALPVVIVTFVTVVAGAQQPPPAAHDYKVQPLNLRKEQFGTEAYASAARARMAAGDCDAALTSFDAALRVSNQDPTLYRDRGLCHEKLGHPYPAIDDYREYLTDVPDAKDGDGIRARLSRLEDETSGRAASAAAAAANDDTDVPSVAADATVSVGAGTASTPAAAEADKGQAVDADDDPLNTPLRRGKGFSLAPFFSERKWFFSGSSFGDSQTWSESIGAQFRYSAGRVAGLLVEVGYEHFNSSTSADPFVLAGLTSLVGLDLRFPLDRAYDNQILLTPALGYEHITFTPTDPELQAGAVNALVPRGRIGYRRVFDDAAFDASLDVGVAKWFVPDGSVTPSIPTTMVVAVNVALVWGL